MLDRALFTPGYTGAIIAHEREAVNKIFAIVKRAYENLPDSLKPMTITDTKQAYRFTYKYDGTPLDSEIYVALKLRSTTVQELHVSEAAYVKDKQELAAGTKQAVPIGGYITEETTGNGWDVWADSYIDARDHFDGAETSYKAYFYAWHENPEYALPGKIDKPTPEEERASEIVEAHYGAPLTDEQLLWRRWKIKDLAAARAGELGLSPLQLFKQEYPSFDEEAFQAGVGNVFDGELVNAMTTYEPDEHHAIRGLKMWKLPEEGHFYVQGCDPSDGAVDYGCIAVWDADTLEKVAEFKGRMLPDDLAIKNKEVAEFYNNAFVGVENNLISTVLFLSKIYDNLYSTEAVDRVTKQKASKLGWSTNAVTRDMMIDNFLILFEEGSLKCYSPMTQSEMRTFVKKETGKREHADGKHDDMLFADMIALAIREQGRSSILEMYKTKAAELDALRNQNS